MVEFKSDSPINQPAAKTNEFEFVDSLLNFDSIENWVEEAQATNRVSLEKVETLGFEEFMDMVEKEKETQVGDPNFGGSDSVADGSGPGMQVEGGECGSSAVINRIIDGSDCLVKLEDGENVMDSSCFVKDEKMSASDSMLTRSAPVVDSSPPANGSGFEVKVDIRISDGPVTSNCCIEEKMEKVSLVGATDVSVAGDGNIKQVGEKESDSEVSDSSSESEDDNSSLSSSSASSSSDDDDDEEEDEDDDDGDDDGWDDNDKDETEIAERNGAMAGQIEEGEIIDDWYDDDEDVGVAKGPIRSKNELEDLPVVPQVYVTLQPNHQTLPVGVILSIIGAQVIVEGVEEHNPLNEGSILWITESRKPLGLVDETFGPVKNPYYLVRYNSEYEVPVGIHVGTSISFVPEFANLVLDYSNLHKKGYDASNENDEELGDEVEFSDDEKEAEYRRMQKQALMKRKKDNRRDKNKDGNWKDNHPVPKLDSGVGSLPPDKKQAPMDLGDRSLSSGNPQASPEEPSSVSLLNQLANSTGFMAPSNVVWGGGMGVQQQQNMLFPNGIPTNGMPWLQQNPHQHPFQLPFPQGMPFQQQFGPNPLLLPNVMQGGQTNFVLGSANAPWMGFLGQNGFPGPNGFTQTSSGMGLQGQPCQQFTPVQGVPSHMLTMDQSRAMQQPFNLGNSENSPRFSPGSSSGRGSNPNRRGRGRFAGGRGRH